MKASRVMAKGASSWHRWIGRTGDESGVAMMFILLMMGLITIITVGVMLLIAADLAAGIRQVQGVRVSNVGEAGIDYAIARLQASGASTYAGETISITDGSTVLGTAVIVVDCIDGAAPPCTGANAAYRRIVSTGTLPVSGATRTFVAVLEGTAGGGYAFCGRDFVTLDDDITIEGDVGSDGSISLLGGPVEYPIVQGNATAGGSISCSLGCPMQVAGTTAPSAPGPICPPVSLPSFNPGSNDFNVVKPSASMTMNGATGYNWKKIYVEAAEGVSGGCAGSPPFRDLVIETGPAGTTTVVNADYVEMADCTRLIIAGPGKVELRLATSGTALKVSGYARVGVTPDDTLAQPKPVPVDRFTVKMQSTNDSAVTVTLTSLFSGIFEVPNGGWSDTSSSPLGTLYGSLVAKKIVIDRDFLVSNAPGGGGISILQHAEILERPVG